MNKKKESRRLTGVGSGRLWWRCLFALVLCVSVQHASAAQVEGDGRAVFIRALATAEASGVQRALVHKDWVFVSDTLRTSAKSSARFVMRDHTMLAMKPLTSIVLAEYEFKADASAQSKMVTEVVSGSLRALTGLVDKRDPERVVLHTPLATAGVRGTAIRIDLFPDGKEEIIFDFGHGYVQNKAGRVNVEQGWGARVVSVNIPPQLFKVDEDRDDVAFLALMLHRRLPPDYPLAPPLPVVDSERREVLQEVSARAAGLSPRIDDAALVLLLGMLEQVPGPDPDIALAVLEGLLRQAVDSEAPTLAMELVQTEIQLVPERAPAVIAIAAHAGVDAIEALDWVLGALMPVWPEPVDAVIDAAVGLGVEREAAVEVLRNLRQSVPCIVRPGTSAGGGEQGTTVDSLMCRPEGAPLSSLGGPSGRRAGAALAVSTIAGAAKSI